MEPNRKRARLIVDIAVTLTTVLDSVEARIMDLSENGAQIFGASLPTGEKFQIEYEGQTTYAQCMWSEIDRMGVRFPFALTDGPLHDVLMMGSSAQDRPERDDSRSAGYMPPPAAFGSASAIRMGMASFGRRSPG